MNDQLAKQRIEARQAAEAVVALAQEEAGRCGDEGRFWRELIRLMRETAPIFPQGKSASPAESAAMTDEQARRWERTPMPFGKYQGTPVHKVSLLYLDKLTDETPFMRSLKRYLASETIATALRQEMERTGQGF